MKYCGTRLCELTHNARGEYSNLAERMAKYRKARKNSSENKYRIETLYKDGHNIKISTLSALMKETGRPIDFFIDFEPWELPASHAPGISGSGNILYSSVNDNSDKVSHLEEIIRLKNDLLADKDTIIALKDAEIEQWKKRYDDLIKLAQLEGSDKNRT